MASDTCCQLKNALLCWGGDPREEISRFKCTQVDGEKGGIMSIDHEFPKGGQQRWGKELGILDFEKQASPD